MGDPKGQEGRDASGDAVELNVRDARRDARDVSQDHAAIRRIADELLPALMARLEASPLGELEVSQDGWRLRLRKPFDRVLSADDPPPATTAATRGPKSDGSRDGLPAKGGRPERMSERNEPARRAITSPAVGTFHPRTGSGLGRAVRAGDVVGHVEVLGVPQEVLAPFDGTLGRVLVEPGQVVEYGEQLMRIESSHPGSPSAEPGGPSSGSPSLVR
jgi:acetyl-CoA carboxylase biotin carboxyl carrier protein